MRISRLLSAAVVCAALAPAMSAAPPPSSPAWDKLKTLAGNWTGTYAGGDGQGSVKISYKLVSNGTSLMETLDSAHDATMVTMYHPDGGRIMATHYCAAGNQPRMVASNLSADGRTLAFSFLDVSNASGPDDEVMRSLVVTFQDPNHFTQAWTSRGKGGQDQVATFTYTRVP